MIPSRPSSIYLASGIIERDVLRKTSLETCHINHCLILGKVTIESACWLLDSQLHALPSVPIRLQPYLPFLLSHLSSSRENCPPRILEIRQHLSCTSIDYTLHTLTLPLRHPSKNSTFERLSLFSHQLSCIHPQGDPFFFIKTDLSHGKTPSNHPIGQVGSLSNSTSMQGPR